jgi:outer membrane protein OmpA-like peptidoglycan-associated protein
LAIGLCVSAASAQHATPSQSDIAGQLLPPALRTTRGLPTPGVAPRPASNPAMKPASVSSASPSASDKPGTRRGSARPAGPAPVSTAAAGHPAIGLDTIQFAFDSADLLPQSVETLKNLGNALNQELKDQKSFLIEGHTDAKGTRQYNDELSKRRADAVRDYLVKDMGVSADRLQTVGKGSSDPALPKRPYAAQNRRVVIVNTGA